MNDFSLRALRKTNFLSLYEKLLRGHKLSFVEREALLEIAVILLNAGDANTKELAYRVIVIYSNLFDDYVPLYDVALNKGYIPVLKIIEAQPKLKSQFTDTFFNAYTSASAEMYKDKDIYLTYQQSALNKFFIKTNTDTVAIIAPTSYGKSELIIDFCNRNNDSSICILVPTKALLTQTRRRLLQSLKTKKRKLITHPEMYNPGDTNFIAVLTQERLLRLIRKDNHLSFSTVFIDEAHNMLDADQRSVLLAETIALLEHRNKQTAFKFLSPFLVDAINLKARYTMYDIEEFKISESIKTERYYTINFNTDGIFKAYDQFLNKFIPIPCEKYKNDMDLIRKKMASKNIIYLNSPPKIEQFSKELISKMKEVDDKELILICDDLSSFLHADYALIDCIKHGFIYHHGSVPDVVRLYIESLFSTNKNISIVVTSSTLLEGVNIPAEKLFLLEYTKGGRKLSPSQFKNLSGRVCRFSELFDKNNGSLSMLEPAIFIIGSSYVRKDGNIEKFLADSIKVDKVIKDDLQNVLLTKTDLDDNNTQEKLKADEFLENIQQGITKEKVEYATTKIGKLCFLNSVTEISILAHEHEMATALDNVGQHEIRTPEELLWVISNVFIVYINDSHADYDKLIRLRKDSAQKFYCMFLKWRMRSASYREMIRSFLKYWETIDEDYLVYVGKWGDTTKEGYKKLWVDIKKKSNSERVNLAIVRIKEEQDFLDNTIIKFVEVLYESKLLDETMYLRIKYGTEDSRKITMIKCGISNTLASRLIDKYLNYVAIDIDANTVEIKPEILQEMMQNGENKVLIFEVGFYVSS